MVTTARTTPPGTTLEDGHSTKIAFAADADVDLWERDVQPPGRDNGDAIDMTDMHNANYTTMAAQALDTITDTTLTCGYDPGVLSQLDALVGVNGWITIHYPNGDTFDFVGYLKSFLPDPLVKGERPTAQVVVVATNRLSGTETDPVYTASA